MKIVLDTNLLLVSISRRSETHRIFEALLDGTYDLCVSTEIFSNMKKSLVVRWAQLLQRK